MKYTLDQTYVFLDFDGVCTACDSVPGSYITNRGDCYGPTPRCIDALRRLIDSVGAVVVVSSNWRKFEPDGVWRPGTFGGVRNPLPKLYGALGDRIVGTLPPVRHVAKPAALRTWFVENGLDPAVCRYVILDDDPGEGFAESEFAGHFILTDPAVGFSDADAERAKAVLGA